MADIANVVKNLLGGADAKTIRSIAQVVVAAMSRLEGEQYQLVPASSATPTVKLSGFTQGGAPTVKKPKRHARHLKGIDYEAKPNGYALVGEWLTGFDLSKGTNGGELALVSIPNWGMVMGKVKHDNDWDFEYEDSGKKGVIKHFVGMTHVIEHGDYASVIAKCRELGLPQMVNPAASKHTK
jgi:hypothetical protein|tara:strand:- start:2123 stop:2668 length:546 start_codon:yes stop_codon:yes gene_type:complete